MSETSSLLSLPYIQGGQAQKHVTHNEALRILDVVTQLSVVSSTLTSPPSTPQEGERYIIPANATDEWADHDGDITIFSTNGWVYLTPNTGWHADISSTGEQMRFNGTEWVSTTPTFQNLEQLGINTTADTTNRLAVSSDASLLSHQGTDHQLKINKNAPTDTASLVFQTDWSGRAEIGTVESDNFTIKTSHDGATWNTAMKIDPSTGVPLFPAGGVRPLISTPVVWYIDPNIGDDANDGLTPSTALKSLETAVSRLGELDGNGTVANLNLADGTHVLQNTLAFSVPLVGFSKVVIQGNIAAPNQVILTTARGRAIKITQGSVDLKGIRFENTATTTHTSVFAGQYTQLTLSNVQFTTVSRFHIEAVGARVEVEGGYEISGDCLRHISCVAASSFYSANATYTLSNTPDFDVFIFAQEGCTITYWNPTFTGTATGRRFFATLNGLINTYGKPVDFLPGSLQGVTNTGGQYV